MAPKLTKSDGPISPTDTLSTIYIYKGTASSPKVKLSQKVFVSELFNFSLPMMIKQIHKYH